MTYGGPASKNNYVMSYGEASHDNKAMGADSWNAAANFSSDIPIEEQFVKALKADYGDKEEEKKKEESEKKAEKKKRDKNAREEYDRVICERTLCKETVYEIAETE